jgi:uncharacterized repeat protein (TIGR03803 family)
MKTHHWIRCPGEAMRGVLRRCWPALFCAALAASAGAQTEQVTFSFGDGKTGENPSDNGYALVLPSGHVMGTAMNGGGGGVVFEEIPPTAKDPDWHYKEIYHFQGGPADGYSPVNGLTKGKDGVLYGLTAWGGLGSSGEFGGCGVVYQLTPPALTGTGAWAESVIYDFQAGGSTDGCKPYNTQLLFDKKTGALYGTTELGGGTTGDGTLFRLNPPAEAGQPWTETVLYRFTGGSTGANPTGGLGLAGSLDDGIIYGTTLYGGSANDGVLWGYITSTGTMSTVYTFLGGTDGASPRGGVIGPFPANPYGSNYYLLGTTAAGGGSANCSGGCGTVFAVYTPAGQLANETILHAFQGEDGDGPMSGLAMIGSAAWGTTESGGGSANCGGFGCGTLFKIQVSGVTYRTLSYVPVYNFLGGTADGAFPTTGLAGDSAGNVYGMNEIGGANNDGTLFEYVP